MARIAATSNHDALALLPHCPLANARETQSFLTDVMIADDSTEDRVQSRSRPRISVDYTLPLMAWQEAAAMNTLYGALRDDWALPMWMDAQEVGSVGGLTINCDTTLYDLRAGSMAMLVSGDDYQVVEIHTVGPSSIMLYSAATAMSDALLIPLRRAWLRDSAQKTGTSKSSTVDLTFEVEVSDLEPLDTVVPTQYLGDDAYVDDEPSMPGAETQFNLSQRLDLVDQSLGPVAHRTVWSHPQYSRNWRFVLQNRQQVQEFRSWFQRRAGKYRQFWASTYEANLRVKGSGTIVSTLQFELDDYITMATQRTHVVIKSTSGVLYLRALSAQVKTGPTTAQATLSSPINLPVSRVSRISWLGLNRLNSDAAELTWIGGGRAEVTVPVLELTP